VSPPGQTRNQLSATAIGSAVQARSIHGGVHFRTGPGPVLAVPLPRQLPPRPAYFTDRSGQLAAIADAAAAAVAGSLVIVVIAGAGGTGKTAVAVQALHEAAAVFPGGQLYAALGGFSPGGPVSSPVVVAWWLRALGMRPPADPAEAVALFRSLTAGRPVAVLADDATDAGQVRALLPGAGLVIVTSRYQMSGLIAQDGARLIRLGPLEAQAAAELARRIIARPGTSQDDLAGLARCCGHLPLAIRAAAARLVIRPHLPVGQVTRELDDARSRLHVLDTPDEEVTAAMQTSYDDLSPEAARAYRLLATCPGPSFTQQAAAALLDTDTATAAGLIGTLTGASLLEETSPGRWRYHDLTGEHARQLAVSTDTAGERVAAIARVTDYYLRGSAAADLLILPGRLRIAAAFALPVGAQPAHATPADALAWCDAEQANLLAAQQAAADLGLHTLAWLVSAFLPCLGYGWRRLAGSACGVRCYGSRLYLRRS
jgi:hypothetical protein